MLLSFLFIIVAKIEMYSWFFSIKASLDLAIQVTNKGKGKKIGKLQNQKIQLIR